MLCNGVVIGDVADEIDSFAIFLVYPEKNVP